MEYVKSFPIGGKEGYVLHGTGVRNNEKVDGTIVFLQIGKNEYTFIFAVEEGYSYDEDIESWISSLDIDKSLGD